MFSKVRINVSPSLPMHEFMNVLLSQDQAFLELVQGEPDEL